MRRLIVLTANLVVTQNRPHHEPLLFKTIYLLDQVELTLLRSLC